MCCTTTRCNIWNHFRPSKKATSTRMRSNGWPFSSHKHFSFNTQKTITVIWQPYTIYVRKIYAQRCIHQMQPTSKAVSYTFVHMIYISFASQGNARNAVQLITYANLLSSVAFCEYVTYACHMCVRRVGVLVVCMTTGLNGNIRWALMGVFVCSWDENLYIYMFWSNETERRLGTRCIALCVVVNGTGNGKVGLE